MWGDLMVLCSALYCFFCNHCSIVCVINVFFNVIVLQKVDIKMYYMKLGKALKK